MDQRVANFVVRAQAQHRAARTQSDRDQLQNRINAYAEIVRMDATELTRLVTGR